MLNFRGYVCVSIFMSAFICVACMCNCVWFFALKIEQEAEKQQQPPLNQEQSEEVLQVSREEHQRKGGVEKEAYSDNNITDQEEDEVEDDDDDEQEAKPCLKPTLRPVTTAPSVSSASGNASPLTPISESPRDNIAPHENSSHEAPPTEELRPKIGLSLKLGLCVIKITAFEPMFKSLGQQDFFLSFAYQS